MTTPTQSNLSTKVLRAAFYQGVSPGEVSAFRRRREDTAPPAGTDEVVVYRGDDVIAAAALPATEASEFASQIGLNPDRLRHTFLLTGLAVEPTDDAQANLALVVFLAMRRHRIVGRTHYVAILTSRDHGLASLLRTQPVRNATNQEGTQAAQGRIDEAMLRCFEAMDEVQRAVARGGFAEEIRAAVKDRVGPFVANPTFEAARAGSLSQDQYIHSIANQHQYVRYTTRILGLAVSNCEDPELRRHFAMHLSGEVNHEVWLEEDLAYLDGDVDYVKDLMVPDAPIMKFSFITEALTSFRRDPVVFMGVPIAIEGAAAHTPMSAIEAIQACIRSWGYDRPEEGTRFLARHIEADAGQDGHEGHWDATLRVMSTYVKTERQQQQILRIIDLIFQSLQSAYSGYVAQPSL